MNQKQEELLKIISFLFVAKCIEKKYNYKHSIITLFNNTVAYYNLIYPKGDFTIKSDENISPYTKESYLETLLGATKTLNHLCEIDTDKSNRTFYPIANITILANIRIHLDY